MLSIVIPTYNELENVELVAQVIGNTLSQKTAYEIVFVDDSRDDTPNILSSLAARDPHIRFVHRDHERGLGTAVVQGFRIARGDYVAVMDADMQHPPEMLLAMLDELNAGAEIVIPSRFVPGGDDGGLKPHRKLVSAVARYMGKALLKRVRRINDPTGGFFAFRRNVIEGVELKPIGWKILIEILVRGNYSRVTEIPYRFQPRNAGVSKMSLAEQWNYIRHLLKLASESPQDRRFFLFAAVGVSGVFMNMVCYDLMVRLHVEVAVASVIASLIALASNFTLNDRVTWSDVRGSGWLVRAWKYFATSLVGIGINVGVLSLLFYKFSVHYLIANLMGIIVATFWNYALSRLWTWRSKENARVQIVRGFNR